MKLHLPKALLVAVLTCHCMVPVASAGTVTYTQYEDYGFTDGLQAAWSFDNGAAPDVANIDLEKTFAVADGAGVSNSADTRVYYSSSVEESPFNTGAFTFSFDLKALGDNNWKNALSLYTNGGTGATNVFQLQRNGAGHLNFYSTNFAGSSGNNSSSGAKIDSVANITNAGNLTLTYSGNILSIYVGGKLKSAVNFTYENGATPSRVLTGFRFGGLIGSDDRNNTVTVDNIGIWNKAFNDWDTYRLATSTSNTSQYWSGGTGNWNTTDTNWDSGDSTGGEVYNAVGNQYAIFNGNEEATITVNSSVVVGTIDVQSGNYTFQLGDGGQFAIRPSLSVAENATASFDMSTMAFYDVANAGTLNLKNGAYTVVGNMNSANLTLDAATLTLNGTKNTINHLRTEDDASSLNFLGELTINQYNNSSAFVDIFKMSLSKISGDGVLNLAGGDIEDSNRLLIRELSKTSTSLAYNITGSIALNGWGNTSGIFTVCKDFTVENELRLESDAKLIVDGGKFQAATIGLGHTEARNSAYLELHSGSIVAQNIKRKNTTGTHQFTMSGGTLKLTSAAGIQSGVKTTISGGVIDMSEAAWTLTDGTIGGATVTGDNVLTLAGTTTVTSTITNQGKLALSGVVNVAGLTEDEVTVYSEGIDGFSGTSTGYSVVNMSAGSTLTNDVTDWQINGSSASDYTFNALTGILEKTPDSYGTIYYLNSSGVVRNSADVEGETGYVINGTGATLQLTSSESWNDGIVVNANSSINVAEGITLAASSVTVNQGARALLTGAGTYEIVGGATAKVSGLTASDWTGTVRIAKAAGLGPFNISAYGNTASTVALRGVSAWLALNTAINTNVLLENSSDDGNGLIIADHSNGQIYNFTKKVSGDGDLIVQTRAASHMTVKISEADATADWKGGFILNRGENAPNVTLSLQGGGKVFNSETNKGIQMNSSDGTLNVQLGNDGKTTDMHGAISNNSTGTLNLNVYGDTSLNKEVKVSALNVQANATAQFADVNSGNISVANSASATFAGSDGVLVTGRDSADASMQNVSIKDNATTGTTEIAGTAGRMSNTSLQFLSESVSYSLSDITLVNSQVQMNQSSQALSLAANTPSMMAADAGQTVNLALNNVKLDASSSVSVAHGTMSGTNNSLTLSSQTVGVSLTESNTLSVSTEQLSGITLLSGSKLTIDLSAITLPDTLDKGEYTMKLEMNGFYLDEIAIANADQQMEFIGAYYVTNPEVAYTATAMDNGAGTLVTITGLAVVPEPTSTTLSLLALTALAARRRRK